jgi:hypothetical protein
VYVPPRPSCRGKPLPAVGAVEAFVVDRPGPGRVVVEAWAAPGPLGEEPVVSLLLPDGAALAEGADVVVLGRHPALLPTWVIDLPDGEPRDAVVRVTSRLATGEASREIAVRLTP